MAVMYIDARQAQEKMRQGAVLVDVRSRAEYAAGCVEGSLCLPLETAEAAQLPPQGGLIFACMSGGRTRSHADTLAAAAAPRDIYILDGGLNAWRRAGLPFKNNTAAGIDVMRQVQIVAGGLVLLGVILGAVLAPGFVYLSAAVGAGLLFAGLSGWCGMARLLARIPWNRVKQ